MKSVNTIISKMKEVQREAEQERANVDARWLPEAQAEHMAEVNADESARLTELLEEGLELVEEERQEAELRYHKALRKREPQNLEEWVEASVRQAFILDDLAAMSTAEEILEAFKEAEAVGDKVGCYLLAHHGLRQLDEMIAITDVDNSEPGSRAMRAYRELRQAFEGKAYGKYQSDLATLREQEHQLKGSGSSEEGMMQEARDRFGIKDAELPEEYA